MASPHSAASHPSNPFEGPAPPPVEVVRDLDIFARVPVVLDYASSTYYAWKTYFSLVFREYHLIDHVDGSVDSGLMFADDDWLTIDATITCWLYQTISKDIFHTIVCDTDDAQTVWTKLNGLFLDNALQRRVFLQQEFLAAINLTRPLTIIVCALRNLLMTFATSGSESPTIFSSACSPLA